MDELERIKLKKLREMMTGGKSAGARDNWPDKTLEINDANFKEVIQKYPLVVVDCWAEWCAPCRMVAPVVEELTRDYKGKIVFGKLNVDLSMTTAREYGIMSIPTLLVFKNGELVDQIIGALPRSILEPKITRYL